MISWMVRSAFYALALAALGYVVVFVPIGKHTLYRHGARIFATPEAQELKTSVSQFASSARQALVREAIARSGP